MQAVIDIIREKVLWAIIAFGLAAGLIGAYGKQRNDGQKPTSDWWVNRACLLPFLAIVVTWATDQFRLNPQQAALLASVLSLMGFEAVRIIEHKVRQRMGVAPDVGGGEHSATPKPYASLVDSDAAGRPTAHVVVTPAEGDPKDAVGQALRDTYGGAAADDDMNRLLDRLGDRDF